MRSFVGLAVVGFFVTGCEHVIPPPAAPAAEWPVGIEMRTTPPEPGKTRIALDANGEKAAILEVTAESHAVATSPFATATAHGETTRPVCVAPCVVDLSPGMHLLRFQVDGDADRHEDVAIQIGDRAKVVRHTVGRTEDHFGYTVLGIVAVSIGASFAAGGAALIDAPDDDTTMTPTSSSGTGVALLVGGLAAMAVSIPLFLLGRTDVQQGSTTTFAWQ